MEVWLAYGEEGLRVELPEERTTVVQPVHAQAAADPMATLHTAMREPVAGAPLREIAKPGQTVAISMCDGTRPQPRHLMIPAVLEELDGIIDLDDVTILVATGTHRGNTEQELRRMLGDEVYDSVRVVNHDARDPSTLTWMGEHGDGVPVWLNTEWVQADLRITTGFVEPHFFAGFSGGPKLVTPGLAALDTVLTLHDASRIGHPNAIWGIIEGNPVHDDIRAVVDAVGDVHFALDVTLNREQQIVRAFGGELSPMHRAACEAARGTAMQEVPVALRGRGDDELRLPARPEPLPGREGDERGVDRRPRGRHDRLRRRVPRRLPRPRLLPRGPRLRAVTTGAARRDLRAQGHRRRPVAGPGPGEDPGPGGGRRALRLPRRRRARTAPISATPTTCRRPSPPRWTPPAPDARVCVLPEGPQTIPYVAA